MENQAAKLTFAVHLAEEVPIVTDVMPPGEEQRRWPPISATLISGQRDAVLADTPITMEQARALADWIAASGKNLTTVYITHGHGDHWLGLDTLLKRFPNARAVTAPAVVECMRQASTPQQLATWNALLPGQIADTVALAEPLDGHSFELEGHELTAVDVGHTDTDHTTVLHVPDIGLVVAGDAVYNEVHLHLSESPRELREKWLAALDTIESLSPRIVVAGHKRPGRADTPENIEETRRYINDFDRIAGNTGTALELYEQVLALYPDRLNRGALWSSARALKQ
jgi:glyoxylase-like metal-dependent hydrolase (beta-lactamase superfamily II)